MNRVSWIEGVRSRADQGIGASFSCPTVQRAAKTYASKLFDAITQGEIIDPEAHIESAALNTCI